MSELLRQGVYFPVVDRKEKQKHYNSHGYNLDYYTYAVVERVPGAHLRILCVETSLSMAKSSSETFTYHGRTVEIWKMIATVKPRK